MTDLNGKVQNERQIFATNLKKCMEYNGKSQSDIVTDLGFTASTVSDWVNAKKYPRVDKMQILSEYLGVTLSTLREDHGGSLPTNVILTTGMAPVIGVIPAGVPVLAEQNIEGYMPVMFKNPQEYFYLRVRGDSMINAHIVSGCLVLVHQQNDAENGDIIACRINGDEATLKRFKRMDNTVLLMPENSAYEPIIVSCDDFENGYAQIIGVVRQVVLDI